MTTSPAGSDLSVCVRHPKYGLNSGMVSECTFFGPVGFGSVGFGSVGFGTVGFGTVGESGLTTGAQLPTIHPLGLVWFMDLLDLGTKEYRPFLLEEMFE